MLTAVLLDARLFLSYIETSFSFFAYKNCNIRVKTIHILVVDILVAISGSSYYKSRLIFAFLLVKMET